MSVTIYLNDVLRKI